MKILFFTLMIILVLGRQSWGESGCIRNLEALSGSTPTERLISYLNQLLEQKIITSTDLLVMAQGLEDGKRVNPLSESRAAIDSHVLVHREEIDRQIKVVNADELISWLKQSLREIDRVAHKRTTTQIETRDAFRKMEFVEIPPSQNGPAFQHTFEMMTTPVTQKMWVDIMGTNPSYFYRGENSSTLVVNGKTVAMQPDNPVEMVSWWAAAEYANRLSRKMGYEPFYDMTEIQFHGHTSAEKGTLQPILETSPKYHFNDGYRLPSESELDRVLRATGTGVHLRETMDFQRQILPAGTFPVGQEFSLTINRKEFFDFLVNISEWTGQYVKEPTILRALARIPDNSKHSTLATTHNGPQRVVGFRLVRTIKE